MKKLNLFILLTYFCLLVGGTLFFYFQYYPQVIDPVNKGQRIIKNSSNQTVFFETDNNLYKILASNSLDRLGAPKMELLEKNVSSTNIATLDNGNLILDQQKDGSKIIEFNPQTKTSRTLISSQVPGLDNYSLFTKPVISPDKRFLLFKAGSTNTNALILFDLTSEKMTNLATKIEFDQLYDYTWANDQIVFIIGSQNDKFVLLQFNTQNQSSLKLKENSHKMIDLQARNGFAYFLKNDNASTETNNLYRFNLDSKKQDVLAQADSGNTISGYSLSDSGDQIVIESTNLANGNTNLSLVTGSSQSKPLTNDGKSSEPIFLTNSKEIVYWKKGDGIYKISLDQNEPVKLLNLLNNVEQIFAWR